MSTNTSNDITTLAQAAAYKAYLSLIPQIHHKTVNMSQGATSAEPLKPNHPLDHKELITKADELICMHFDSIPNDNVEDKEEARKATRFAADKLFHHLSPKHNNSPAPTNTIDNNRHSSPKSTLSNYNILSASNSDDGNKPNSLNENATINGSTSQDHTIPLHPTTTTIDDSIPFERAVPGDAANPKTQSISIDSIPARVDETDESALASVITSPENIERPSYHIGGKHKIQTAILNQGLPISEHSNTNLSSNTLVNNSTSSSDNVRLDTEAKEENNEGSLYSKQHVARDDIFSGNNTSARADDMPGHKICNKHSKLAGYIGQRNNPNNNGNDSPSLTNNDDTSHGILKRNPNPEKFAIEQIGNSSVAEMV